MSQIAIEWFLYWVNSATGPILPPTAALTPAEKSTINANMDANSASTLIAAWDAAYAAHSAGGSGGGTGG